MFSKSFAITVALAFPVASAWADTAMANETADRQPVAAQYRETRHVTGEDEESADWYLIRQRNQVEIIRGDYAEVWQRDERGELTLSRVFHGDRKLIQYTPGELRTQGRQNDWSVLNTVIDPRLLSALKQVGTAIFLDRPALRYEGKLGGEQIELLWLAEEGLVARLVRSNRDASVALDLKNLLSSPDASWPHSSLARTDGYAHLDGADLGDMEYDPFVQRVLAGDSAHGGHEHYAH